MERYKISLSFFVIGFVIACSFEACKVQTKASPIRHVFPTMGIIQYCPVSVVQLKQDTPKVRRGYTPDQVARFLDEQSKRNYDRYFAGDMRDMKTVISDLAATNKTQAETINNIRLRSIRKTDSLQTVQIEKDKEHSEEMKRVYSELHVIREAQSNSINSKDWDKATDRITIFGIVFFFLSIIITALYTNFKVKKAVRKANKDI